MIVVSDTTPLISLLKIERLDLLEKLFGQVLIPKAVFDELNADVLLMDEAKGRTVSFQMGFKVMGTIGILMAAYEEKELTADEIRACVDGLQNAGRHISRKHYQMLLDRIRN
ncbi:MAG: DUF3368 domain-containing protein [Blautia sp.]|nr:DUF3368 domain-containing protein [Lachnoclostridium sp.]MCM1211003.1 DUF3368 domain-containing protein [Blautia sp.]